jgi:hypothetical protein
MTLIEILRPFARSATAVLFRETHGFQGGRPVRYVSTDASDSAVAALEDVNCPIISRE